MSDKKSPAEIVASWSTLGIKAIVKGNRWDPADNETHVIRKND